MEGHVCWFLDWIVFIVKCGVVNKQLRRHSPISFKHECLSGVCSLILTPTTHQSNLGVPLRKSNRTTPAYLVGLWQPEDLFQLPILPQNLGHASSRNRQTRATWCGLPNLMLFGLGVTKLLLSQNGINTVARRYQSYWKPVNMFHESIDCAISLCFMHPLKSPLCKVRPNVLALWSLGHSAATQCVSFDEFHLSFNFNSNMSRGVFKNKNECRLASTFHSRISPQC